MTNKNQSGKLRFAAFEVDLSSCELLKHGIRIKLQDQPFQILARLLEQPGVLVSRENLRRKLWAVDTFVDFDAGLNAAIRKGRRCCRTTAMDARWIFTNEDDKPDGHSLRKFNAIAKKAGLNCGHCKTTMMHGKCHLQ